MKRFESKPIARKESSLDPYADFQGSKAELYMTKFFRFLIENRTPIGLGFGVFLVLLIAVVGFFEYKKYRFEEATLAIEEVESSVSGITPDVLDKKIEQFQALEKQYHSAPASIRIHKTLAELYALESKWENAASEMKAAADSVTELESTKALYYFIAGNYSEKANKNVMAIECYSQASRLVENQRELSGLQAWSLYQLGRMQLAQGEKDKASVSLRKILDLNIKSPATDANQVKQYATYLLLKMGQTG